MPDTDKSLLKSFVIDRDEKAFRVLSERYLGLVFHIALRRTGNRQLSEEVSQNILCALAQKASSLARNPDQLPGWLHRATLFESSKAMRSESSHQRCKQLLDPGESAESPSPWKDAIPHLDRALDKLPESDRRILLLHFFENLPFPKIARSVGKNPDAVQKQSRRALDKLARILRGKGVVLTATALATGLTTELAKAAPAALVQSCVAGVTTGSATYSTTALSLMTLSKSKALVPLVLLLCALPLALQEMAISAARSRIGKLQAPQATIASVDRSNPIDTRMSDPNDLRAWKELARRCSLEGVMDKRIGIELRDRLAAMTPDQILEKLDQMATWDLPEGDYLENDLLKAAAAKDPQKALMHFEEQLATVEGNFYRLLKEAFGMWIETDPSTATAWLDEQIANGKLTSQSIGQRTNETCRNQMEADLSWVVILEQLKTGAGPAIQRFLALATDQQRSIIQFGPRSSSLPPEAAAGLVAFMRGVLPEDDYLVFLQDRNGYQGLAHMVAKDGDLEKVARFLDSVNAIPEERRLFAAVAASTGLYRLKGGEEGKVDRAAIAALREWLVREAPGHVDWSLGYALGRIQSPFEATAPLVEAIYQETGGDDVLISYLSQLDGGKHARERRALAGKITDHAKRDEIMEKLKSY